MATPIFCCGFECGTSGHFQTFMAAASFSTSTVRSGARSLRVNPTAATGGVVVAGASSLIQVARVYIRFASLPTADTILFYCPVLTNSGGIVFKSSDSSLYAGGRTAGANVVGASGIAVTTGVWYRLDLKVNHTSNPWVIDAQIDGVAVPSYNLAVAGGSGSVALNMGQNASGGAWTGDVYFDDVLWSQTSADYPLGAGYVNHFVPTSDGTHTSTGTNIVKGTIASPTGGGNVASATDVFNWVNGVPILGGATDNTRLVNQQTVATQYAEVKFGPAPGISTPTVAPRAVEVITADREASTATCDFITKLNDNGTENSIIARGVVAGVTTDRFATKQYATPPTGGAWNLNGSGNGAFNNIRARFGYSTDATPDIYWRGIMIEAEFVPSFTPKSTALLQQIVTQ